MLWEHSSENRTNPSFCNNLLMPLFGSFAKRITN